MTSEGTFKAIHEEEVRTFSPIQMLQRLSMALTQEQPNNTFEHLLNKIPQIVYSSN